MIRSAATGALAASGKLKILLLVIAFGIIAGTLWYTHDIVRTLQKREQEIAGLYARSLQFIANAKTGEGDYNFVFSEIINTIDFPIIMTDRHNEPSLPYASYTKNVEIDTMQSADEQKAELRRMVAQMDLINPPIKVAYQDSIVLSYVHFGESVLVTRLRWLPTFELGVAALFILIGYISFSYIKRSEQSNIWVGMARETAHQLGTPISSMMGWVELLREQTGSDDTLRDMENDLVRLQKIADRFSKIGSKPDLHSESLPDVIARVIEYFQRRIPRTGKKVTLTLEAGPAVVARINRELFEWVLENLTKNALDAIESGEGRISYSISEHGRFVFVDVSDTGKGIDLAHRKDVFRPGFSTKKRGWGLGLSLSKRIIESYHKGKLFLKEAKPGFKTTFRIRIKK